MILVDVWNGYSVVLDREINEPGDNVIMYYFNN